MGIRTKFLIIFLIIAIIPLIMLAYFTFGYTRSTLIEETKYRLETIADIHTTRVTRIFRAYNNRLTLFADRIDLTTINDIGKREQISTSLKNILPLYDDIQTISLVNPHGQIIASTDDSLIGQKQAVSEFPPTKASKDVPLVDILQQDKEISQIRFRKPLSVNDTLVGELEIITKNNIFTPIADDYSGLGSTGEVILAKQNDKGAIFFMTPRRFDKTVGYKSTPFLSSAPTSEAVEQHEGFFIDKKDYHGKQVFAVTRYLPDVGWGLVADIDEAEALRPINLLRDIVFISSFIFIILIILVTLFFVYSITAPIVHIASIAKQIPRDNFSKRALVLSKDEIGELAKGFNAMLDSLQELHENLEKKVQERTQQLETSNKDLEAFTYSVSHDLRAPLRAIDGFSQILEEDYAAKFDHGGKQVISTIRKSTQQMGTLIDDLLAFSRFGRKSVKRERVAMAALVKAVFDELKHANPKRRIQFISSNLPTAQADTTLMRQVWINLLSNAIKFTKNKEHARITVGSNATNDSIIYYVKDNGVGFNMKYIEKLFGVFQRLHGAQEFEGSGVGLAIVERIIDKHGGKVWAEGKVNQGAAFYFSLPKHSIILKQKDYP